MNRWISSQIVLFVLIAVILAAAENSSTIITADAISSKIVKVQAGGGNGTAPLTTFSPQQVQIKAGDSVSWYNPTQVGEPHTITFIFDNKSMTGFATPFSTSSSAQFMSLPRASNSQPLIMPGKGGMSTIVAINARVYNPAVIGASGNVKLAGPNANYTLSGTEKYVNSGFLLPKGLDKDYPGSSNTFTVTFQKAGVYNYICIIHPWMQGKVVVTG